MNVLVRLMNKTRVIDDVICRDQDQIVAVVDDFLDRYSHGYSEKQVAAAVEKGYVRFGDFRIRVKAVKSIRQAGVLKKVQAIREKRRVRELSECDLLMLEYIYKVQPEDRSLDGWYKVAGKYGKYKDDIRIRLHRGGYLTRITGPHNETRFARRKAGAFILSTYSLSYKGWLRLKAHRMTGKDTHRYD